MDAKQHLKTEDHDPELVGDVLNLLGRLDEHKDDDGFIDRFWLLDEVKALEKEHLRKFGGNELIKLRKLIERDERVGDERGIHKDYIGPKMALVAGSKPIGLTPQFPYIGELVALGIDCKVCEPGCDVCLTAAFNKWVKEGAGDG